jgi:hypothetical protein
MKNYLPNIQKYNKTKTIRIQRELEKKRQNFLIWLKKSSILMDTLSRVLDFLLSLARYAYDKETFQFTTKPAKYGMY